MDKCLKCETLVDTDEDVGFYDFTYHKEFARGGHCENCRDALHEQMTPAQQAEHEQRTKGSSL